MDNENRSRETKGTGRELCGICGKPIFDDEEKVYCPECGTPMHKLCFNMTHSCPNEDFHKYTRMAFSSAPSKTESGSVCDICRKPLREEDDKVYCPECGTPVHRECWEKEKECPNEYRHIIGYDWNKDHKPLQQPEQPISHPRGDNEPRIYSSFEEFTNDMLEKPIVSDDDGEELTCGGVHQDELLHFLGLKNYSTPRFFSLFLNMANTGRKISFNISALFFSPFYHFYRRMTGPAVLITIARMILFLPTLVLSHLAYASTAAETSLTVSSELNTIASVTTYISFGIQIFLLLFSDYIYMKWSVRKILYLREKYKDTEKDIYFEALESSGNPSMVFVFGGLALMFLLFYIFYALTRSVIFNS